MTDPQTPAPAPAAAEVLCLEDAARLYREAVAPLDALRTVLREAEARCIDDWGHVSGTREDHVARHATEDALALQQGKVASASASLRAAALALPAAPASAEAGLRAERDAYREVLTALWELHNYPSPTDERAALARAAWTRVEQVFEAHGCATRAGQTFEDGTVACWTCGRVVPDTQAQAGGEGS